MPSNRVLVIGLDGAPFPLLKRWADEGLLPNIARLIERGSGGVLASTVPPTSGPAWTSFSTGMNPGRTGVYDFLFRRAGSYVFPPVNASMRSGRTLWRLLSEAGKKIGVVNVPISYPVEPVEGTFISGWMTPYFAKDYTWPPSLAAEIESKVGDYRIYPSETFSERGAKQFFEASDELLELLTRTTLYLMERDDWDLFMTVYFDVDRILHQLWHALDDAHPWRKRRSSRDAGRHRAAVERWFAKLDADIGRVIAKASERGEEPTVLLMSDHGMGYAERFVVLNNLLLELGLLKLDSDPATRLKHLAWKSGFSLRNVHRFVDGLGIAKHAEYKNVYSFDSLLKRFFLSFHNVDWAHSRAYSFGRHYGSLFLNLKGREPKGIVEAADYERTRDEIAEALLAWKDPELGRPLVSRALRREEIWHGSRLDEAPDLVLLPEDEADIFYGLSDFGSSRVWDGTYRYSGMHRDNGTLIAAGPLFAGGGAAESPAIIDLAPTLLYLLDCEIPPDMDGRVLREMLSPSLLAARPEKRGSSSSESGSGGSREYSAEEEAEVMQRLRDLGYLN